LRPRPLARVIAPGQQSGQHLGISGVEQQLCWRGIATPRTGRNTNPRGRGAGTAEQLHAAMPSVVLGRA
jgi:hypothetical protein